MNLSSDQVELIHKVIHDRKENGEPYSAVRLGGILYPVQLAPKSKCRFILIDDLELKFIEQNKQIPDGKSEADLSKSAQQALSGSKITWAIPLRRRGPWGKIVNGVIETPFPGIRLEA